MLRIKQLPTFDSTASGVKNVVDLPLGLRYHVVWLEVGNDDTAANGLTDLVEDIVVKINGKPQRTHSADQLNQLNGLNAGFAGDTGVPTGNYFIQASGVDGEDIRRLY